MCGGSGSGRRSEEKGGGERLTVNLEVETSALRREGAYARVGHGYMGRMLRIGSQGVGAFQGAVEHDIASARRETVVNVDSGGEESGHLSDEAFQAFFHAHLHRSFLSFREFGFESPEDDVLYQK